MDHTIANLGSVIRRHRIAAGMNVKELATETGYSSAYISQLESGTTLPSLSALATMAVALGIDVTRFFPPSPATSVRISKAGDVNKLRMSPSASEEYTILSSHGLGTSMSALIHRAYPTDSPPVRFRNAGERFALVQSGAVRFVFDGEETELTAGECVHFSSQRPYSMEIVSNGPAEILWFVTPAIV
ncbi:XRE family transcriptional regulator [Saccharopolyspora shandongensis]|uniref:helix-turn-helix domain-containing protein n=1 Tax=Saccharopolyspora shandongensis TaxID=418495 RepID=UPI00343B5787